MEIFEMARLLGMSIYNDETAKNVRDAKEAYQNDEKIRALTTEFDMQQKALSELTKEENKDEKMIDRVQTRIGEIYEEVLKTDAYRNYEAAQKDLNVMMEKITHIIYANAQGLDEEACTHDCSTCGGCS